MSIMNDHRDERTGRMVRCDPMCDEHRARAAYIARVRELEQDPEWQREARARRQMLQWFAIR